MPETPRSFHHWQPASRWRLHQWPAKPDNPAMSPHAPRKTSTCYTNKQLLKVQGGNGGEKLLNPGGGRLVYETDGDARRLA